MKTGLLLITLLILVTPNANLAGQTNERSPQGTDSSEDINRYLYVAVPGIRDYLGYGGHGLLVFDIDNEHSFVKRIKTYGFHADGTPSNVKGVDVSKSLNSIYISTLESLQRIDLQTEELVWEIPFEGGCDRMSISPDGLTMYLPSLEKNFWNVVECESGTIIKTIDVFTRAHNTIYGPSGKRVYLGDIGTPFLHIAETDSHILTSKVGPFYGGIRPFTINRAETLVFVNVNDLLGFEVGDLHSGRKLASIKVEGWDKGPVRRHGNPSHGIGLTPDEQEIWISDGHNMRLHIFEAEAPYQQLTTIPLKDMPGWITFSMDGQYAYPSSGEVIDVKTRQVITHLVDESYNYVSSEKMVEIHIANGRVIDAGDQFGLGQSLD